MKTTTTNETVTLYLNSDERLGMPVIGTAEEFSPMLGEGEDITDFDVFAFSTLEELLHHLMDNYPHVQTVEDAVRKYLSMTGSELVEKIS